MTSLTVEGGSPYWSIPVRTRAGTTQRLVLAGAVVLFAELLRFAQATAVAAGYGHLGPREAPFEQIVLFHLLALLPVVWLRPGSGRPSSAALIVLYALVIIPSVHVLPAFLDWPLAFIVGLQLFIVLNFGLMCAVAHLRPLPVSPSSLSPRALVTVLILIAFALSVLGAWVNGFQLELGLSDVYIRRLAAREIVPGRSLLAYALALLATTLVPLLLAVGIARRSIAAIVATIAAVAVLFSFTGEKSIAATPILVMGIWVLTTRLRQHFAAAFIGVLTLGMAAATVTYFVWGDLFASSLYTRRLFVATAYNASRYFEFFLENPYYYLSDGPLRGVISSPYDQAMGFLLGGIYYGALSGANMGSHLWATAFGEAGFLGMVLASLIAGFTLWLLDCTAAGSRHAPVYVVVGAFAGYILSGTSVTVALISGGLLPALVLLYLYSGSSRKESPGI